jgi:nitrite reductase/ring-hydroxylating ferredoxin subunit
MLSREQNDLITRVGPGTPMGTVLRAYWLPVLLSEEVAADGEPLRVKLLGEDLIAFRAIDGRVGLLADNCPHRGASLFFGRNEEGGLRCVYHGWKFAADGTCLDMPNEPAESDFRHKVRAIAYPCEEHGGIVWTYLGDEPHPPALPGLEWNSVPDTHRYVTKRVQDCNWAQATEGGIDPSHSGFLHAPLHVDPSTLSPRDRYRLDKRPGFSLLDRPYGLRIGARRNAAEGKHFWSVTHFLMPFYNAFSGGGGEEPQPGVGGFAWVPMDDYSTMAWCFSWNPLRPLIDEEKGDTPRVRSGVHLPPSARLAASTAPGGAWRPMANRSNEYLLDRTVQRTQRFFGVPGISGQDAAVQESMGAIADRSLEHLGSSDSAVIRVRRLWLQAIHDVQLGLMPLGVDRPESYRVRATGFVIDKEQDWTTAADDWITAQPGATAPQFT